MACDQGTGRGMSDRPSINLIVAFDDDYGIGKDNDLPWHLPADLKRFKALTMGHPLLMGRKTAQSLGRALPGRLNIVMTRSGQIPFDGMVPASSLEQALELAGDDPELWVIGGGEIFKQTLPIADMLYLTYVKGTFGADAFFPRFNRDDWESVFCETHEPTDEQPLRYTYETLRRRAQ